MVESTPIDSWHTAQHQHTQNSSSAGIPAYQALICSIWDHTSGIIYQVPGKISPPIVCITHTSMTTIAFTDRLVGVIPDTTDDGNNAVRRTASVVELTDSPTYQYHSIIHHLYVCWCPFYFIFLYIRTAHSQHPLTTNPLLVQQQQYTRTAVQYMQFLLIFTINSNTKVDSYFRWHLWRYCFRTKIAGLRAFRVIASQPIVAGDRLKSLQILFNTINPCVLQSEWLALRRRLTLAFFVILLEYCRDTRMIPCVLTSSRRRSHDSRSTRSSLYGTGLSHVVLALMNHFTTNYNCTSHSEGKLLGSAQSRKVFAVLKGL